jgi:hypothetical protein
MIQARYRQDYPGEFVVIQSKWSGGKKTQTREWIPNPIENQHLSGRAACIGSAQDRYRFDYAVLQTHRGGLLSSKKLQTYGVGEITHDMILDFAVETLAENLEKILESQYAQHNIVYTTSRNCVNFPGNFYLIPHGPIMADPVAAVYLAAFDGHKEIFLLGYTDETPVANQHWIQQLSRIIEVYAGTQFYLVGESTRMPDQWANLANTQTMSYPDFIGHCDV